MPIASLSSLLPLLMMGAIVWFLFIRAGRAQQRIVDRHRAELASVLAASRSAAEEDVTRFGEELQDLDSDVVGHQLDEAMQQDYTRALDAYDHAKDSLDAVQRPEEISNVTEILEDGRYAVACVKARVAGEPLPQKRPPCFFNPAHGPSARNVKWAPNGGVAREVPACLADAERVETGADPYIRTVQLGSRRVPYWEGGAAYAPWARGYYTGWRGNSMLGDMLVGSLIFNGMSSLPFMLGGMGQGVGQIGGGLGQIGDGIGDGLGQIGNDIGGAVGDIGNGVGDAVGDIGNFFGDLF